MASATHLSQAPSKSLEIKRYFRSLKDPRRRHRRKHRLMDIIVIAICAVIANANDWREIEKFGRKRVGWLRRFLTLENGVPSHDTFERVFDRIDPLAFQRCWRDWLAVLCTTMDVKQVAVDGKTLRRSGSKQLGALHLVSAWATANHLSLGQVAVDSKSNEITAIPQLLELLDLKGALVTIDAMGCQTAIAEKILEREGHYLLAVKRNQEHLWEDVHACVEAALDHPPSDLDTHATDDHGHGRDEKRIVTVIPCPTGIRQPERWPQLQAVVMCTRDRTVKGHTSTEASYYITSKKLNARQFTKAIRSHWGIENNLHWQMDISFGEDSSRIQARRGAENFAFLRRLALTLLKRHPSKDSIAVKRYDAALDTAFLEEILLSAGNLGDG